MYLYTYVVVCYASLYVSVCALITCFSFYNAHKLKWPLFFRFFSFTLRRDCATICVFFACVLSSKLFFSSALKQHVHLLYCLKLQQFFIYKLLKNMCVFITIWIFVGPLQIKGNCCCECWFFKYLINGYGGPPKHYFIPRTILFPDRFSGRNTQKSTRWCWGKSRQIIKLYL